MKFNSQICTTRKQSERLMALGLKRETADMALHFSCVDVDGNAYYIPYTIGHQCNGIPAWSLHRLWELGNLKHIILDSEDEIPQIYEFVIDNIEKQIKQKCLNKEYLV